MSPKTKSRPSTTGRRFGLTTLPLTVALFKINQAPSSRFPHVKACWDVFRPLEFVWRMPDLFTYSIYYAPFLVNIRDVICAMPYVLSPISSLFERKPPPGRLPSIYYKLFPPKNRRRNVAFF